MGATTPLLRMHGLAVTLEELNGNQKKHKGTLQLLFMLFFYLAAVICVCSLYEISKSSILIIDFLLRHSYCFSPNWQKLNNDNIL